MNEQDLPFYLGDKVKSKDGFVGRVNWIETPHDSAETAVYGIEDENDGIERVYFVEELTKGE